jgi:hypothetical protein
VSGDADQLKIERSVNGGWVHGPEEKMD